MNGFGRFMASIQSASSPVYLPNRAARGKFAAEKWAGRNITVMEPLYESLAASHVDLVSSREAGLNRLRSFLPHIVGYARQRNLVREMEETTSRLSPFLRMRLVQEREIVNAVLAMYDWDHVATFIDEIGWRTYWKGYLENYPGIWASYLSQLARIEHHLPEAQHAVLDRARRGETGIECFDAWVDQLVVSGWLHNHARMWFASIWIFTLKLPWQLGAAFFLEHLLDGDPACNTLSWRWVAGLHTSRRPYLATAANISRFTCGVFNPAGQLVEKAEDLPVDGPFEYQPLKPLPSPRHGGCPDLSDCPAGLLVTPEDLSPEVGELGEAPFSSICALSARDRTDVYHASAPVRSFLRHCIQDAAGRLARHWRAENRIFSGRIPDLPAVATPEHVGRRSPPRLYSGEVDNWLQAVRTWVRNENLRSVFMLEPPTGPWRDVLPELQTALRLSGVRLHMHRRRWDALHWPHATQGYFSFQDGFRDRVEQILQTQPSGDAPVLDGVHDPVARHNIGN